MFSELQVTTVGVSDLQRSVEFYRDVFGYVIADAAELSGGELERVWQMPHGTRARCAVLGPDGAATGLLRLVSFDAPGERIWRQYERRQDYGHYALNIRVANIDATLDRIAAHGGQRRSGPTRWSPSPQLPAWDSLSYDPDGVLLDVFQIDAAADSPLADFDRDCSEIQTVAIHVSEARSSAKFYGAMGYIELYDKLVEGLEGFFGLPAGTALHNINLYVPGQPACGRVELAQYVGFPGRQQRERAVPPNLGILSASIRTDDLPSAGAQLRAMDAEPVSEAAQLDLPPYGSAHVQSYFGLDGEVLELFQPL